MVGRGRVGQERGLCRLPGNIRQQLSERVGRGRGHILRLPEHIFDGQETLRTQRLAFEVSGLSICFCSVSRIAFTLAL